MSGWDKLNIIVCEDTGLYYCMPSNKLFTKMSLLHPDGIRFFI